MLDRLRLVIAVLVPALLLAAAPAVASLGDDVAAGRRLSDRLQAGSTRCAALSPPEFERVGEYAMQRMAGSLGAHAALDRRMTAMMGAAAAERMHKLMGRRFAGCATAGAGWSWMRAGAWRHMTAADWQRVRSSWMGPAMMSGARGGWSAAAVAAVAMAALLAGAFVALLARGRRRPARG
jgi:hypothetical protein